MNRPTLSFAQRVDDAIARSRSSANPLPDRIVNPVSLTDVQAASLEDSEDWLSLDEQGLEDILQARQSKGGGLLGDSDMEDSSDDDEDEDDMEGVEGGDQDGKSKQEKEEERKARKVAKKLEQMAGKVENFVEGRGAASGALFDECVLRWLARMEDAADRNATLAASGRTTKTRTRTSTCPRCRQRSARRG